MPGKSKLRYAIHLTGVCYSAADAEAQERLLRPRLRHEPQRHDADDADDATGGGRGRGR